MRKLLLLCALSLLAPARPGGAQPALVDAEVGLLELLTPPETVPQLDLVDGLAFDPFGNLFAALEIPGPNGGLVRVDADSGAVERVASGISRADQVALLEVSRDLLGFPVADFVVTSEVVPAATVLRLFLVRLHYDLEGLPPRAEELVLTAVTSLPINNPEGVVVIDADGPFGPRGTLYVCEDFSPGRVLRIDRFSSGATPVVVGGLRRPEGLAFGDFGGAAAPALYAAETTLHRVIRIDADGAVTPLGDPAAVGLTAPDNVEFGPDGFLYVSEDRRAPQSRIVRVGVDGTHEVFATGFGQAAGLAFHPENGDLYVSEQDFDRIWRVRFAREARVDVVPRSPRNRIRPGGRGLVPVAIFGAEDLDAREIDAASLAFGPAGAPVAHDPRLVDLDRDGRKDLLVHFRIAGSGIAPGETLACVRGSLFDGRPLRGCDAISTVLPKPRRAVRDPRDRRD